MFPLWVAFVVAIALVALPSRISSTGQGVGHSAPPTPMRMQVSKPKPKTFAACDAAVPTTAAPAPAGALAGLIGSLPPAAGAVTWPANDCSSLGATVANCASGRRAIMTAARHC